MKYFNSFLFAALLLALAGACGTNKPVEQNEMWFCSTIDPVPSDERAVLIPRFWTPGQTINIVFKNGTPAQQQLVKDLAQEWVTRDGANLKWNFTPTIGPIHGRWAFDNVGSWSTIGTDALARLRQNPSAVTTNFGWVPTTGPNAQQIAYDMIRHEIGHFLGAGHEHLHMDMGCMDTAYIIQHLMRTQGWDEQTVRYNVIDKYKYNEVRGFIYDPTSVLHYPWPIEYQCASNPNRRNIPGGKVISATDKQAMNTVYPWPSNPTDPPIDPPGTNVTLTRAQIDAYWQFDATVVTAQQKAVAAEATAAQLRKQADDLAAQGRVRLKILLKK